MKLMFFHREQKNSRNTSGYPSNSPDMNSIEFLFSYWNDRVLSHKSKSIDSFIKNIKKEWDAIDMKMVRSVIRSQKKKSKVDCR